MLGFNKAAGSVQLGHPHALSGLKQVSDDARWVSIPQHCDHALCVRIRVHLRVALRAQIHIDALGQLFAKAVDVKLQYLLSAVPAHLSHLHV